ncbi:MAG TPA: hypothetical protein VMN78_11910 [Longimicrobiales bacterium]|nr:hypothetical protein [Longimicrobiales bacterium]
MRIRRSLLFLLSAASSCSPPGGTPEPTERQDGSAWAPMQIVALEGVPSEGEAVLTADGSRLYYAARGTIHLHDLSSDRTTRIFEGPETYEGAVAYLALSRQADLIAFSRDSADEIAVMALPLDPASGLPSGPARRISSGGGDSPAISADGRHVVYAGYGDHGTQEVTVASATGTDHRVLGAHRGGVGPLGWSPDGDWIYFGVSPLRSRQRLTLRVPTDGGAPDTLLSGFGDNYPGLSPDGRFLVVAQTASRLLVFDAEGRPLGTLDIEARDYPISWRGDHDLILVSRSRRNALRTLELDSLMVRELSDAGLELIAPAWSPDGRLIAAANPGGPAVVLLRPDGSVARTIPLDHPITRGTSWSPDGRWILYYSPADPTAVRAVELATGVSRELLRGQAIQPLWLSGSDGILYALIMEELETGGPFEIEVGIAYLDGTDRRLSSYRSSCLRFLPASDSTAVLSRAEGAVLHEADRRALGAWLVMFTCADPLRLVRLSDMSVIAELIPEPGVISRLNRSDDGGWASIRTSGTRSEREYDRILFFSAEGDSIIDLPVPFTPADGRNGVMFMPDGAALALSKDSGDSTGVHLVNPHLRSTRRLTTISTQVPNRSEFVDLSPDGSTLVYVSVEPQDLEVAKIDVADGVRQP